VENCVLSNGVIIEKGAIVKDSVIMSSTVIKSGAKVMYSIIDSNTIISNNAVIGEDKSTAKGITVIGSELMVQENAIIPSGAMVNNDSTNGVAIIEG
jgi:glucose-1-phosphate adenylyltransferase